MKHDTVALGITGASGIQYGLRLLECLLNSNRQVYLMITRAARAVISLETDLKLPRMPADIEIYFKALYAAEDARLKMFGEEEWNSPLASGSGIVDAMIVCPCTMGSLAAIATGTSNNLLERAADVMLKERRKLILVPRETPFSEIHLENMLRLTRMGVVILPANPGFYNRPKRVEDVVDHIVARILDHLEVEHQLQPRWGVGSETERGSR